MDAPRTTENENPNKNLPEPKLTKQYLNTYARENRANTITAKQIGIESK